ncbi:hypothetical protein, partial [Streptococcus suis]|uniref:hypothetical protein n=1 Tax=Streptococcus suis TaxID=1307 RepID=UPI0019D3F7C9
FIKIAPQMLDFFCLTFGVQFIVWAVFIFCENVFGKLFSLAHFLYYGIIIFCEYPSLTRG